MHNIQHSIIWVSYENAPEVWYRPELLHTLDLGSTRHLSRAEGMLHIDRMLADDVLHIAMMLADGALHIARMLANDVYVHWLGF